MLTLANESLLDEGKMPNEPCNPPQKLKYVAEKLGKTRLIVMVIRKVKKYAAKSELMISTIN